MEINIKIDFSDTHWNRLPSFIQGMYIEQLSDHLVNFTLKANREISQYLFLKEEREEDAVDKI